jgi:prophage antirepressor-like protein
MDLINELDTTFLFKPDSVRVIGISNEPWFVAKDVCTILGLTDVSVALRKIPEEWKTSTNVKTSGGAQDMRVINESGLYKLIMRSNKPIAEQFQHWVCSNVLTTIKKQGKFKINESYERKIKELTDQKENAEQLLVEKNKQIKLLQRETQVVDGKNVVYLATTEEKEAEGVFTVGKSVNLKNRLADYNNNKLFNFKIVKYISCKSARLMDGIEQMMLCKLNKYKIIQNRDVFQLPKGKDVSFFTQHFDYIDKFAEEIDENIVLDKRSEEEMKELDDEIKEDKSTYNKTYRKEHHEEILEREADFREMNKEILRERTLDYAFENRDTLNEKKRNKSANWTQEQKDAKKEYMQKYRQEKSESIAESKKKYNEAHKEVLEERIKCACGSMVSRKNMSYHLKTVRHTKYLETGKTVDESRKESYIVCGCGMTIAKSGFKRHETSKIHKNFIESQKSSS